jgi:hypothetical protein
MSLIPEQAPPPGPPAWSAGPPSAPPDPAPRARNSGQNLRRACFAIAALAAGLFLAIAPWLDSWTFNYLQGINPAMEYAWESPFLRGGLSGLGLVNLYIGFREFRALLGTSSR